MERGCGVYLKISSLPSKNSYGCFSKEAYDFIDFLSEHNIKYWEIEDLANFENLGENASVSGFAINPLYLDESKFLVNEEIDFFGLSGNLSKDEYIVKKNEALRYIFDKHYYKTDIDKFILDNEYWVYDYAVYMSLKDELGVSYAEFPIHYKNLDSKETITFIQSHSEEIIYYIFLQYLLVNQWKEIKKYAKTKNVKIIARVNERCKVNSSDVYSKPSYFKPNYFAVKVSSEDLNDENFKLLSKVSEIKTSLEEINKNLLSDKEEKEPVYKLDDEILVYNFEAMKKDRFEWFELKFKYLSKLYDFVVVENDTYFEFNANIETKLDNLKENVKNTFDLDMITTLKNKGLKNIIFGSFGNNLFEKDLKENKINYPLFLNLDKIILRLDEETEENNLYRKITEKTILSLSDFSESFKDNLSDKEFKEKACKYLNLAGTSEIVSIDDEIVLKSAIENMLSSNAVVCILDVKDIISSKMVLSEDLTKDNKEFTEDKKGEYKLSSSYQSEKYFEYLKQVIANKNR